MKSSKFLLLLITAMCVALLGVALYLQIVEEMAPCPLCIIQRYLLVTIAVVSGCFAYVPERLHKPGAGAVFFIALGGVGTACWHLWVQAHPGTSCGIDPLETSLNTITTAKLFPLLFKADGLCATPYPFLGLSIPQWSLISFTVIAFAVLRYIVKPGPLVPSLA